MRNLVILTALLFGTAAYAHDVWVATPNQVSSKEGFKATLSYSHNYPQAEPIAADRVHIFKPLEIVMPDGNHNILKLAESNYIYKVPPLAKGTYKIVATYQPTFWVEKNDGTWAQGNLKNQTNVKHCEQTQMFGKAIVVSDGDENDKVLSTPVGQELEIVPLASMGLAQAGDLLPMQILYNGKPLANATVTATADTVAVKDKEAMHHHREIQGFSAKTDDEGKFNFLPLVDGLWKVKIVHQIPYDNQQVCHQKALYSTLIVPVGTERAQINEHDEHEHHHH